MWILRVRVTLAVVCVATVVACASVESVKNAPFGRGDERVFEASAERIQDLVMKALWANGLDIESTETRENQTIIMATTPMTMTSWGDIIRVILTPVDSHRTRVNVYWRTRFRDTILELGQWDEVILQDVDDLL